MNWWYVLCIVMFMWFCVRLYSVLVMFCCGCLLVLSRMLLFGNCWLGMLKMDWLLLLFGLCICGLC